MQTLDARIQMQRGSFEPGRLPEAGVGSHVVKERGSVAWRHVALALMENLAIR